MNIDVRAQEWPDRQQSAVRRPTPEAKQLAGLRATELGKAIRTGDPYEVKKLVGRMDNRSLRFTDRKGNTYLHYMCTMNRPYVFNILVAAGLPLNAINKDGNTALHVTALHNECCQVPDLMQCGIDPYIKNKYGKLASDLASSNPRWMDLYSKYEPTLRLAIRDKDWDSMEYLFGCWSAVHLPLDVANDRDMRSYAAGLTFHDIVARIDTIRFSLMAVFSIKELNYKSLEYALSRGSPICDVNFLQQVRGSHPHHMLQHAIRLKNLQMVDMLLDAGSDVNSPVYIHEYIRGPLFFEVIRNDHKLDMDLVRRILDADVDLRGRDERGRSALMYCIDRRDGDTTLEIIELLLQKGINIAMRDNTGCTARDVALFARRQDIVKCIDDHVIEMIRTSNLDSLQDLATDGYQDLFLHHQVRDSWIYAAGNDTDLVTRYLSEILDYWETGATLHYNIEQGDFQEVKAILENSDEQGNILRYKDKSGRGPLLKAVLFERSDIANYVLSVDPVVLQERDNSLRGVGHYIFSLDQSHSPEWEPLIQKVTEECQTQEDVFGLCYAEFQKKTPNFINEERPRRYGMEKEVHCLNKYEELVDIIQCPTSSLKHFEKALKNLQYPIADFYDMFHPAGHPLVSDYQDLLSCAVNHRQLDIARKLVHLKLDCSIRQPYQDTEGRIRCLTAEERAHLLDLNDLADYIVAKGVHRIPAS